MQMSNSSGAGRSQSPDASNLSSASTSKSDTETSQNPKKTLETSLLHAKGGTVRINTYDKDWRVYHCKTWHLEPTVR